VIATIGLPGSNTFAWTRVTNAAEAEEWRAAWLAERGEATQQDLNAVRQGLLLTEREAMRARWRDGSPIYAHRDDIGRLVILCEDWRTELAAEHRARNEWFESVRPTVVAP
jgi:hypothetical protein